MDPSANDSTLEGSVADAVAEIPSSPSFGSAEPVACDVDELVTKSVGLLHGRPEFVAAGTALIPETAPRLDGWKEKLEAEVPVFK